MTWEEQEQALMQRLAKWYAHLAQEPAWQEHVRLRISEIERDWPGFREMARKAWEGAK